MSERVVFITDEFRSNGFELAGLDNVYAVNSTEDVINLIESFNRINDIAIIMIQDKFIDFEMNFFKKLVKKGYPLILSLPSIASTLKASSEDQIQQLIRNTIGISIKL